MSHQEVETTTGPSVQPDVVINPHAVTGNHSHSDTVTLPYIGTITVQGGIYTVVLGGLAALTVIEVLIASVLDALNIPVIKTLVLFVLAIIKAVLVVMFYMHLRQDNRVFRVILGLPLLIAVLAVAYLLSVPGGSGMGYPAPTITYTPSPTSPATATPEFTATPVGGEATSEATGEATSEATPAVEGTSEPAAAATLEAAPTSEATTEATAEATAGS